jgi:hypothetical protein
VSSFLKRRAAKGEVVGGGFIVVRRGDSSGRMRCKVTDGFLYPFEWPTREAAETEALRLSQHPNAKGSFCVLQQISEIPTSNCAAGEPGGTSNGHTEDSEKDGEEGGKESGQKTIGEEGGLISDRNDGHPPALKS